MWRRDSRRVRSAGMALSAILVAVTALLTLTGGAVAEDFFEFEAGELNRPTGYREWVYVGTPLTPNELNNGKAAFPEFHNVYIDPESWGHYKKTGNFRDGTVIAKELTLVGVTAATSGNGFFMGEFSGFEIAYKSTKHFPNEPGNWAYFSFGHQPEPYNATAAKQPVAACAACHIAAAAEDMVFTQYYPVVRAAKPK